MKLVLGPLVPKAKSEYSFIARLNDAVTTLAMEIQAIKLHHNNIENNVKVANYEN